VTCDWIESDTGDVSKIGHTNAWAGIDGQHTVVGVDNASLRGSCWGLLAKDSVEGACVGAAVTELPSASLVRRVSWLLV
jgi:hypothetical protein